MRLQQQGDIRSFGGASTPEVERLDGLLGVTPIAIGELILVEVVQGFRQVNDVATARQLISSLAPLSMRGDNPSQAPWPGAAASFTDLLASGRIAPPWPD
ncbi:MAG: hypothetical protein NTW51_18100 [Cyanobacteria bacterium]|nr:hypothetical protein [Cyanobacteriota bacterium]